MRAATASVMALLLTAPAARAKTVESFQAVATNEVLTEGPQLAWLESAAWVQKPWTSFDRSTHTVYLGVETLMQTDTGARGNERFGFDVLSLIVGYRLRTYLPDWYNFQIRLRVPFAAPPDSTGRTRLDRLEVRVDPLLYQKTWNLWTISERNRLTWNPERFEFANKLRFINVVPDLDFPIATYVGIDLRLRRAHEDGSFRARNDFLLGMASNFTDWMHLAVELKSRVDTKPGGNIPLMVDLYLEFNFDIFFDNTFGGASKRQRDVRHDERD